MAVTEVRRNDGACERVLRGAKQAQKAHSGREQGMGKRGPLYCTVDNSKTNSRIVGRGSRIFGRPEKMRRKEIWQRLDVSCWLRRRELTLHRKLEILTSADPRWISIDILQFLAFRVVK